MGPTVRVDNRELEATWTDTNPRTKGALEEALPVGGSATRWGDELYVTIDVDHPLENPREVVEPGTVAYWPQGPALCLFWGPTPASESDEPRAASPVNVVALIEDSSPLMDLAGAASLHLK